MHVMPQESEDEQLARAIAASLGQETTSSSASEPASQTAHQVAAASNTPRHFENTELFLQGLDLHAAHLHVFILH